MFPPGGCDSVVQAFLAAENLATILSSWGILNTDSVQELEQNCDFQSIYRNSWADHANLISVQYAGTGALKTDYTRTGVRTHWGLLQVMKLLLQKSFASFVHTVRNLHFLSKNSTLISRENCRFFGVKNS